MTEAFFAERATAAHFDALADLFRAASCPCFCRFWHFEGTNNAWLDRCANQPEENEGAFREALFGGAPEAMGVVARRPGSPDLAGWAKVSPARAAPKIYDRRLYRGLPCFEGDRARVFVLGCLLVRPALRKQHVSDALIEGAIALARAEGASALEALPRQPKEPVSDEEVWTGVPSLFARHGFEIVHAFEPYPVMRRSF